MIIKYDKILYKDNVLFGRVVAKPPTKNCASTMPEEAYLLYLREGECWVYAEREKIFLTRGQSLFLKGAYVGHLLPDKINGNFEAISVRLHSDLLKEIYKNDLPQFKSRNNKENLSSAAKFELNELIDKYFGTIAYYFDHKNLIQDDILLLKIKEAIILMLQTENAKKIKDIFQSLLHGGNLLFKQIIESHIYSDLTNEELAHLANMSLSSFKRNFRAQFNTTPTRYFLAKRLEKAKHLIEFSDMTIADIAYECAFKTPSHFSKKFKEFFNVVPTEMKLNLSGQ